jgi:hypothetical protein
MLLAQPSRVSSREYAKIKRPLLVEKTSRKSKTGSEKRKETPKAWLARKGNLGMPSSQI